MNSHEEREGKAELVMRESISRRTSTVLFIYFFQFPICKEKKTRKHAVESMRSSFFFFFWSWVGLLPYSSLSVLHSAPAFQKQVQKEPSSTESHVEPRSNTRPDPCSYDVGTPHIANLL